MNARCDMMRESSLPTADIDCGGDATHSVPGTTLGPVLMCDRCFAEWLADNDGDESQVIYLTDDAFLAALDRMEQTESGSHRRNR